MSLQYTITDFLNARHASDGSFSPDGSILAILSNLPGTNQLYLVSLSDGNLRQLTFYDEPLSFAEFSPAGNEIMFGMGKGGDEKTRFYLRDGAGKDRAVTGKPDASHLWGGWSKDGKSITYASNERNGTDFDVYVMDVESGRTAMVFNGGGYCESFGFSPSGREVIVRRRYALYRHDLFMVDLNNGAVRLLTPDGEKAGHGRPEWLPGESGFFFVSNTGRDFSGLMFYDLREGKGEYVLTPEHDLENISLTEDGKMLAAVANEDGYLEMTVYETDAFKEIHNREFPPGGVSIARGGRGTGVFCPSVSRAPQRTGTSGSGPVKTMNAGRLPAA